MCTKPFGKLNHKFKVVVECGGGAKLESNSLYRHAFIHPSIPEAQLGGAKERSPP